MDYLSNIALELIVILLPGIIATLITKNLTITKNWDPFKFSIYTILFSGVTYLLLQGVINVFLWVKSKIEGSIFEANILSIWSNIEGNRIVPYREVIFACLLSIFVGLIASAFIRKKILYKIAKFFKVSYKFGDENLFYDFMRKDKTNAIYLKDIKNNIIYHGYVDYYSESDTIRELVLRDVDVYSYKDSKFYFLHQRFILVKILSMIG